MPNNVVFFRKGKSFPDTAEKRCALLIITLKTGEEVWGEVMIDRSWPAQALMHDGRSFIPLLQSNGTTQIVTKELIEHISEVVNDPDKPPSR